MLTLDPRSIILMANFISVFCLVVLLIMCRSFPKSIGGLKEWAWACALAILASALLFARGHIPAMLSVVLGNVIIAAIFYLMYASIRRFSGRRVGYRGAVFMLVLVAALWTWTLHAEYPYYGIFVSGATNTLLVGMCALAMRQVQLRSAARTFSLWTFAIATCLIAARLLTALFTTDVPPHLFDTSPMHKVYLTTYPLTFLATTFGFMLMASDKLRGVLQDMNRTLEDAVAERTADLQQEIHRTRELEREVAHIAESERRRIGRELHDDLGQQLTGISLSAQAVAAAVGSQSPDLARLSRALESASVEAIAKVRRIAHGLMPVGPGVDGLREALMRLASSLSTLSCVACSFDYDDPVDVEDENVAANLFRIAQEALNNAVRHSRATHVLLRLDEVDGKVSLSVADNGVGIDGGLAANPSGGDRGVGLRLMAFRASLINYRFAVETQPGRGTTVRVTQC